MRRAISTSISWSLGMLVALPLSAAYHLTTPLASEVLRLEVNQNVSRLIAGRLEIGEVTSFSPFTGHVVTRDVKLYDPSGEPVIEADTVRLRFHYDALLRNQLHFSDIELDGGHLTLSDPDQDNTPSFVDALQEADPTPSEETREGGLSALVEDIKLRNVTVEGELLGLQGIRAINVASTAGIVTEPAFRLDFQDTTGTLVAPYTFQGELRDASGSFSADEAVGLSMRAVGDVDRGPGKPRDSLEANIALRTPSGLPPGTPAGTPLGEPEPRLTLTVRADPADAGILHELGFEWASLFHGPVRGEFGLEGPPDQLALQVDVKTAGGPVSVEGNLGDPAGVSIQGSTQGLQLDRVLRGAPPITLAARANLTLPTEDDADGNPRFDVELEPFEFGSLWVPTLNAQGTILEDEIDLESLSSPYAGGRLQAAGRIHFDGRAWLALKGSIPELSRDVNVRRRVPGLRGGVTFDLSLQTPAANGSMGALRIAGSANFTRFALGALTASTLSVNGSLRGNPSRPTLDVVAHGRGVAIYGNSIGQVDLEVVGSPAGYQTELTTGLQRDDGEVRALTLAATVETPVSGTLRVRQGDTELRIGDVVWTGIARNVLIDDRGTVAVEAINLRHQDEQIHIEGTFGRARDGDTVEHLEASVAGVKMGHLRNLFGDALPDLEGVVDGRVSADGTVSDPEFELEGTLRDGTLNGLTGIHSFFSGGYGQGTFDINAQATLGTHGSLALTGDGFVDTQSDDLLVAFENAIYDNTRFSASELDLAALTLFLEGTELKGQSITERLAATGAPALNGHLSGDFTLNGPLQAPNLMGHLSGPDFTIEGWPPLSLDTTFSYEYGSLSVQLVAADPQGLLARAEGNLVLDLYQLLLNPADVVASLETLPWNVAIDTPQRRVEDLPAPIRAVVPGMFDAVDLSLSGTARGGALQTAVDLVARGDWGTRLGSVLCGTTERPTFETELSIRGDRATLTGHADLGDAPMLTFEGSARTPISEWIATAHVPEMPEVGLRVQVPEGSASRFIGLCDFADGQVEGDLVVNGLFGRDPRLRFLGEAKSFEFAGAPALDGTVSLTVGEGLATFETAMDWDDGRTAAIIAQLPVAWGSEASIPAIAGEEAMRIEGRFAHAPLAPFVSWVPLLSAAGGTLDGFFAAQGTPENPRARGRLALQDGYIEVATLGQHLSQVQAAIRFENDRIVLEQASARDIDGSTSLRGEVLFEGIIPTSASLHLDADQFPVRQEGGVVANIDGSAQLEAQVSGEETNVTISLERLLATLPDATGGTLQELAPHPDVHIAGTERVERRRESDGYPVRFRLVTDTPIRVERRDFEAAVDARLVATIENGETRINGSANVRSGHYEVFEKRFDIDQGRMTFDGSAGLDPILNFSVSHELSAIDNTVTVTLVGRLSDPTIEFTSDNADCREKAEVIAMLVQGNCATGGSSVGDTRAFLNQTQDFLYGVGLGLGAGILRTEAGDAGVLIPNVAYVDTGYSTAWRAKFDLSFLIPDFLKGIIRSISVEGVLTEVSEEGGASSGQGVFPGGVIEAGFPYNLFVRFQFDPVGFAGDINWEP